MASTITNSGFFIYIITNFACIFMMIPILRNVRTSVGSQAEITSFKEMIWSFIIYVLTDIGTAFFMDSNPGIPVLLCDVITIVNELSLLFLGYFWVQFGTIRLNFPYLKSLWWNALIAIPFILVVILSVTSPFTGLFFSITPEGLYARGPLFLLQSGAVILYNTIIPVLSLEKMASTKSAAEKDKASSLVLFVIAPLIGGIIQLINPNSPVMALGLVIGFYFVYIDILNMQIYNDSLTGLNNRRRAEIFLSDCITSTTKDRPFYVFAVDVDYFKNVNDKYGHLEGDRALRMVGEALKKTADTHHAFAARMGGDEFLISTFNNTIEDPQILKDDLNRNLQRICENNHLPYELRLSVGYAKCDTNDVKISTLISEADQMLYVKKNEHHDENNKRNL